MFEKLILIYRTKLKCTTGNYIFKYLEKNKKEWGIGEILKIDSDNLDKKFIVEQKPDLILAVDSGTHYILDFNLHPKAIWIVDTHLSYICDEVMARSFDIIFVAQKNDYEKLSKKFKNVYWLPLACDNDWHGKKNLKKIYDIAFIGQIGLGRRKRLLKKLKERYPNSFIGTADCEKIGEIYSQAKIVFNHSAKNDINMRVFEALCSGSLLITDKIKGNGFEELFKEGEHLVVYDSEKDLFEKIDYYLKNDEEREKIAENGRDLVLKNHTYEHRLKFILEKIFELKDEKFEDRNKIQYSFFKLELLLKEIIWRSRNQLLKFINIFN